MGEIRIERDRIEELCGSDCDDVVREVRRVLGKWLKKTPNLLYAVITADKDEAMIRPHILVVAHFKDKNESVEESEMLEGELLSLIPSVSNRILAFTTFEN